MIILELELFAGMSQMLFMLDSLAVARAAVILYIRGLWCPRTLLAAMYLFYCLFRLGPKKD